MARLPATVCEIADLGLGAIHAVATGYGVGLVLVAPDAEIPHSYWGEPEAGLHGTTVFVRADTPVHSVLHELSHVVCMTAERRAELARDAGGDDEEECAVCYLQVLLADAVPGFGGKRCLDDMDAWGYSFRQGSARQWFEGDGVSAREWLVAHRLIDARTTPTGRVR